MRAPSIVFALAFLLAPALALPSADALIASTPSRLDVGELAPASEGSWTLEVSNKAAQPVEVVTRLELPEDEALVVEPSRFRLEPHGTQIVAVSLALPEALSGGRHDPRLHLVEVAEGEGDAVGRGGLTIPVVFWVEGPKLGSLVARHVGAGEPASARLLLQNYLGRAAPADILVQVRDAQGAALVTARHASETVEPNASLSVEVPLATTTLPHGAYTIEAQASQEGRLSNVLAAPLLIGERRLEIAGIDPRIEGRDAVFALTLRNAGDVPLAGDAEVELAPTIGNARKVGATVEPLAPGELRSVALRSTLEPGAYRWAARLVWAGGAFDLPGGTLTVEADDVGALQAADTAQVPVAPLAGALALVAGALWLRRKT